MWYDTLLAIVIVLMLLIIVAARATHQTIAELFGSIWDVIREKKEDVSDSTLAYYQN